MKDLQFIYQRAYFFTPSRSCIFQLVLINKRHHSTHLVIPPFSPPVKPSCLACRVVATRPPAVTISPGQENIMRAAPLVSSSNHSQRITDLCSSLQQDCPNSNLGVLFDESDRQFHVVNPIESSPTTVIPVAARLVALPDVLDARHQTSIDIARHRRFEMAANIASALLQIYRSPWLSGRWSKDLFFPSQTAKKSIATTHISLKFSCSVAKTH